MADIVEKVKQAARLCTECNGISCRECPYVEHNNNGVGIPMCGVVFATDVLSVIEQMEQEIERLKTHKPDCDHANHDSGGCLGYGRSEYDDEPIDACKKCEKYTGKEGED